MNLLVWSNILLWIFMIIQLGIIFLLSKLIANFLNRFRLSQGKIEQLKLNIGDRAPLFREWDQNKNLVKLAENNGKNTLLVFTSAGCNICKEVLPQLPLLSTSFPSLRIIVVSRDLNVELIKTLPPEIHFIGSEEIMENYFIQKVPTVVVIDENGIITELETINTFRHLTSILEHLSRKAS
ncbi:TlpA family protein disulfide reductase [Effusibacillus consociatus]|uniref:TlpA family protein disulfide reductase n=1 Tax=Effusibacillus consociatus TaxID=1117041 RepID=A0ABV9Q1V2_9BACL